MAPNAREFEQALTAAKLEALKEFAYGAGHEINNPLANISARAQTLLIDETHPERRRLLTAIHRQAMRAHEMIADLMLFARPPQLQPRPVDVVELVDRVLAELAEEATPRGTTLRRSGGTAPVVIEADETQLAAALRALGLNALEAIGLGGVVEVHVAESTQESPGVQIIVTDTGPGLDERACRHLFDPFFSGREAGRGLGLGLAKCWRIVTDHGGQITVDSQPARGTSFTITLPLRQPAATGG